jgi:hypothetical protein
MGIPPYVCMVRQAHHRREGDKEGVFAAVAIHPSCAVSEDSAIKIFVEGL